MTEDQNRIIEKVLKLMELAKEETNSHSAERESAQKMAAKLMEQYSLDFADLRTGKPKNGIFQQFDLGMGEDVVDWLGSLANGIAKAFDVKIVQRSNPWTLMYCGTKTDIDISIYFFRYLRRSVSMQSSRAFTKKADQKTFAFGMVKVIAERMKGLYEKRNELFSSDSRALMVVKQDGLDEFVHQQFPNITRGRSIKLGGSHEAHLAGKEAGRKVNISRPLGGSSNCAGAIA